MDRCIAVFLETCGDPYLKIVWIRWAQLLKTKFALFRAIFQNPFNFSSRECLWSLGIYIYICLVLLLILESSLCLPWGKFNWFFLYIWIYRLNRHSSDWGFSTLAEVSKRAEQGFIPLTKNTQLNKILKKMWSEHYLALCYRFLFFIWASLSIYFWVLNIKWSYDINNNLHISLHFTLTLN